ncbi:4Fe-4S binding protein [Kiloniella laminariae]|uniref:4Fe-4S binding protein n=1 Tax=Kiloniella laminariae TaxID=454162 RepID=UPI0003810331|nr:4Fe-4S binding protein [Kiloniella laminariae]
MTVCSSSRNFAREGKVRWLARAGVWLQEHQILIRRIQWGVVAFYALLLVVPAFLPLPGITAHIWDDLTTFAQFVFWGIWWPGVLISMLLFGRLWCGVFCPEGALSEFASERGRGLAIPRWVKWPGWPFAAFVLTTVYGQMISVYQYPKAALLILGGSTIGAVAVGYLYGRNKRVWCRYLCPVSGVFGLLSKLAPMHYGVDRAAWDASPPGQKRQMVNCAPLVPIRTMESASPCHMCGRCSGFHNAIELKSRRANEEIVQVSSRTAHRWDSLLIIVGLIGVALGAFQWSSSPWFIDMKQGLALWLVEQGMIWPLETTFPWWVLTDYAEKNDVLTLLDGTILLVYIAATTLFLSLAVSLSLALVVRVTGAWQWQRFHHLAQGLIPFAGGGVILGLSAQTFTLLRADGFDLNWVSPLRMVFLLGALSWSLWLVWSILRQQAVPVGRSLIGVTAIFAGLLVPTYSWVLLFWLW